MDHHLPSVASMRAELWPDGAYEEHLAEVSETMRTGMNGTLPATCFVAEGAGGELLGFLEVGLRSHADGCDVARPVGFVEGWLVREPARGQGIGAALLAAAEDWARSQGCREMASDTWIDNLSSQRAHEALGFEVVDRCVNYHKAL
ncbi:MAG: GNAT family N-acetyltransferase [Bryobacterales bacterium]|nr:GNAT family N-acetyltransferase [Bryobacterales bacterium]